MNLTKLLHANLTKASGQKRDRNAADTRDTRRAAAIADFESWIEAWSVYAAVLSSFPRLVPRLFSYQHFITLKSRLRPLRYDTPTTTGISSQWTRSCGLLVSLPTTSRLRTRNKPLSPALCVGVQPTCMPHAPNDGRL